MKLPIIPQDKANHFIYGFIIYILSNLFLNAYASFSIVYLFALGKECYDEYYYKGFDVKDLIVTIIPAIILILKDVI
jgi:hypothetical protein